MRNNYSNMRNNTSNMKNSTSNMRNSTSNMRNGINLDYDYNTEYGDGDIPNADKNCSNTSSKNTSSK